MFKKDVISHFGTLETVANILGISVSAVSQWKEIIPEKNAYRLQELTNGQLKINRELYRSSK